MPTMSMIIPCFNEERAIKPMLDRVLRVKSELEGKGLLSQLEIIVVDDGSTDSSSQELSRFPDIKIIHQSNQGYGSALKAGFAAAQGEVLTFLDMDCTYYPEDLEALYQALIEGGHEIVYGARLRSGEGMPWIRHVGNWFYAIIVRLFYSSKLTDVCTGMRVFHRSRLSGILTLPENGLDFSMAFTILTLRHQWRMGEHPIRYAEREGQSKLSEIRDGIAFLRAIFRADERGPL